MDSKKFYLVFSDYDEFEVVPNGEWKEEFRELIASCLKQFCYAEVFPANVMGTIASNRGKLSLVVIENKSKGKSIEIRYPEIDENNCLSFYNVLYVHYSNGEVQKRVLVEKNKFAAFLNSPDEPEYVIKGEFATRDAFSLEQKVDDLVVNLKLFSVLRVASYTPTQVLEMVRTVLQIDKNELKNLEIPNLKLKIQDFEIVEAFKQLKHECSVYFDGEQVKYESSEIVLKMIPEKQTCDMRYTGSKNFSAERIEKLYNNALKSIVDL